MLFLAKFVLYTLIIYITIAIVLVISQQPSPPSGTGLDFSRQADSNDTETPLQQYKARDGKNLNYRKYGREDGPLIVVIHGSALNHLPVISFQLLENADQLMMTETYSFRMNTSFAPRRKYEEDMVGLPKFVILVGDQDEAFAANEYATVLDSFDNAGTVETFKDISHLDVIGNDEVHQRIKTFVNNL